MSELQSRETMLREITENAKLRARVAELEAERDLYRDSAWKLEARVAELEARRCS